MYEDQKSDKKPLLSKHLLYRKVKILFPIKEFNYHSLKLFFLKPHLCCFMATKPCYFRYLWPMVRDI